MTRKNSKTAFVLSQPVTSSAEAVIAAGKAKGIELTAAYVYGIRSRAKRSQKRRAARPRLSVMQVIQGSDVIFSGLAKTKRLDSSERQFAVLVADIGLTRAEAIIGKLRASV